LTVGDSVRFTVGRKVGEVLGLIDEDVTGEVLGLVDVNDVELEGEIVLNNEVVGDFVGVF